MSRDINLASLDPDPRQPRHHYDEIALKELATSMQGNGLMQSITVRPVGDRFVIVGGHRRVRAAQALGWKTIRAEVQDISADDAMWLALVENLQREDLSPTEEARGYEALLACGVTQQALGERIGKSQSHIATMLRYLRLPEALQSALDGKLITEGHAKQLLRVPDAEEQARLYQLIGEHDWTVKVLTGEVAQAIQRVEAKLALKLYPERFQPDDELLAAVGCEMYWSNFWQAEHFRHCASRLEGVVSRLMYLSGYENAERRQVYAGGFPVHMDVSIDMACHIMRRERVKTIDQANVAFLHFPARCGLDYMVLTLAQVKPWLTPEKFLACRVGTEQVEIAEVSATCDISPFVQALDVHELPHPNYYNVCTLDEPERIEAMQPQLIKEARDKRTPISVFEEWFVFDSAGHVRYVT